MGLPGPSQAVQGKKDAGAARGSLGSVIHCLQMEAGWAAEACKCLQENMAGLSLNFRHIPHGNGA